jgi:hypothetical protein
MAGPSSRSGSNKGGRNGDKSGGGLGSGSAGGGGRNRGGKRGVGETASTSKNRSSNMAKDERAARNAVSSQNSTFNSLLDALSVPASAIGPIGPTLVQGYKSYANASDLSSMLDDMGVPTPSGFKANEAARGFIPNMFGRLASPIGATLGNSLLGAGGALLGSKAASYGTKRGLESAMQSGMSGNPSTNDSRGGGDKMVNFSFIQDGWDAIRGKDAAQAAADTQQRATNEGIQFQYDALAQAREDLSPFKTAGVGALNDLRGEINNMPTTADIDSSQINDFIGNRTNLDANLQSFLDPQAQADYLANDPLYNAIADDTNRRLNAQASAAGKLHSGGTAKALQDNMMLLGRERVNDRMNQLTTGFNSATADRSNNLNELMTKYNLDANKIGMDADLRNQRANSLMNLVRQGQNSAAMTGSASQNAGNALTNLATAQGNANAAAQIASNNNTMSLINTGLAAAAPKLIDWIFE